MVISDYLRNSIHCDRFCRHLYSYCPKMTPEKKFERHAEQDAGHMRTTRAQISLRISRSLIRAFAVRLQSLFMLLDTEKSYRWTETNMTSLLTEKRTVWWIYDLKIICVFFICVWHLDLFFWCEPCNRIKATPSRSRWLSWMRIRLGIRRLWVRPPPGRQHSFVEIWSWNIFYGNSLPSAIKKGSCQFLAKECAHYWLTA